MTNLPFNLNSPSTGLSRAVNPKTSQKKNKRSIFGTNNITKKKTNSNSVILPRRVLRLSTTIGRTYRLKTFSFCSSRFWKFLHTLKRFPFTLHNSASIRWKLNKNKVLKTSGKTLPRPRKNRSMNKSMNGSPRTTINPTRSMLKRSVSTNVTEWSTITLWLNATPNTLLSSSMINVTAWNSNWPQWKSIYDCLIPNKSFLLNQKKSAPKWLKIPQWIISWTGAWTTPMSNWLGMNPKTIAWISSMTSSWMTMNNKRKSTGRNIWATLVPMMKAKTMNKTMIKTMNKTKNPKRRILLAAKKDPVNRWKSPLTKASVIWARNSLWNKKKKARVSMRNSRSESTKRRRNTRRNN